MSLTDLQIKELAKRMSIPLEGVYFKNELPKTLKYNKSYIINLEDSIDEFGNENDGTHWTFAQVNKSPNGKITSIYFDPYGQPPPNNVKESIMKASNMKSVPYSEKDIQSLMNNACGFYCLALGHFINASQFRVGDLYKDYDEFLEMFDDLNKSIDFKKNEFILKHFFRSSNPDLREPIDVIKPVSSISSEDEKGGKDAFLNVPNHDKIPVEFNIVQNK
jgi:hypothetical protein